MRPHTPPRQQRRSHEPSRLVRSHMTRAGCPGRRGRRVCGVVVALAAAVLAAGIELSALASPFDQQPDSTWQANGRVRAIVYSANAVYIGGEFTEVLPSAKEGGSPVVRD